MSDLLSLRLFGQTGMRGLPGHLPSQDPAGPLPGSLRAAVERRARIWDLSPTFHCSLIGTCLTTGELRQLFVKLGDLEAKTASDHSLHSKGVRTAGQRDATAKFLNKALDRKHDTAIKRFAKASTAAAVRELWLQALEQGSIPGAYWAAMTHPATDWPLVQEIFGEVHMLSHMVGSSNRVDLARLRRLEQELEERDAKLARQQIRLQDGAGERTDLLRRIERLEAERSHRPALPSDIAAAPATDDPALRRRLEDEKARAADLALRLKETEERERALLKRLAEQEAHAADLQDELAAFERELTLGGPDGTGNGDGGGDAERSLGGRTLLYVGGRPGQIERLKAITERRGGELLTHDGGIEDNSTLLPGLVSRAALVFFPVDCVSHHAAGQVKKLCRDAGKAFVPLRTASSASFIAAIGGAAGNAAPLGTGGALS